MTRKRLKPIVTWKNSLAYFPTHIFKGGTAGECGLPCVDAPNRGKTYSGHDRQEYESIVLDSPDRLKQFLRLI